MYTVPQWLSIVWNYHQFQRNWGKWTLMTMSKEIIHMCSPRWVRVFFVVVSRFYRRFISFFSVSLFLFLSRLFVTMFMFILVHIALFASDFFLWICFLWKSVSALKQKERNEHKIKAKSTCLCVKNWNM